MTNKRLKPEEIVSKLRQVEVLMGQGLTCDITWLTKVRLQML